MSLNFKKILSKIDYPADWVGIRYVEEIQNSLSTNNSDVDNIKRNCSKGVMIDVLVDGQFAYYATPYLDEQHILKSIHTACENAKRASKYSIYKFTQEEVRKGHEGTYRTKCSDSVMDLSISDVKDIALSGAETLLRPKEIVHAAVSIELVQRTTKIYSTSGADIDQKMDMALIELSSTEKTN